MEYPHFLTCVIVQSPVTEVGVGTGRMLPLEVKPLISFVVMASPQAFRPHWYHLCLACVENKLRGVRY